MRIPASTLFTFAVIAVASNTFATGGGGYLQTNLVSNDTSMVPAAHQDPQLVNAWGIAFSATSPIWVSDNGTGLSTVYDGSGNLNNGVAGVVQPPAGSPPGTLANPTGMVFNGNNASFQITDGTNTKGANFIWATEAGTISAWNSGVGQPATGRKDHTFLEVSTPNAIYKGLAIDSPTAGTQLYAANFASGNVDVFGPTFNPVTLASGAFTMPGLPSGYAPFGIQNIAGNIFVSFAKQTPGSGDETAGPGLGAVAEFGTDGHFIKSIANTGGSLNAPWGLALAPANFGQFSNDLLVGNFGDGTISAFDLSTPTPTFKGQLTDTSGATLSIDGLWGLEFGNGASVPSNSLIFSAGPNDESDGLLGTLTVPEPASLSLLSLAALPLLKRRRRNVALASCQ
ncbi:MAG TPA: TIGR03118 family protein [Phycisphaerae bacterium]|nr:TIGR03118 family protein [Phycisphaerae bacterium]